MFCSISSRMFWDRYGGCLIWTRICRACGGRSQESGRELVHRNPFIYISGLRDRLLSQSSSLLFCAGYYRFGSAIPSVWVCFPPPCCWGLPSLVWRCRLHWVLPEWVGCYIGGRFEGESACDDVLFVDFWLVVGFGVFLFDECNWGGVVCRVGECLFEWDPEYVSAGVHGGEIAYFVKVDCDFLIGNDHFFE